MVRPATEHRIRATLPSTLSAALTARTRWCGRPAGQRAVTLNEAGAALTGSGPVFAPDTYRSVFPDVAEAAAEAIAALLRGPAPVRAG
ncbi:hypothetical protein KGD83_07830 [Nocardiopsis akebiae]|uniref:Uncharacterized protein n=1 Tax=Nocardiopsis akebiae TaxID=2831968 RepID=A0ABX8CG89_9ACTN|nr:hypothetical protein [Nocardiopsis akebiae]QUX32008.1 hypothetical protein KGD83_07830 [Nocardiopsis akebiae]